MTPTDVNLTDVSATGVSATEHPSRADTQFGQAIRDYDAAMPPGQVMTFKLSPLDRTGVPVWIASFRGDDGLLIDGIGYGASDDEALCGAYGELCETTRTHHAIQSMRTIEQTSYTDMVNDHGDDGVIDPRSLCLSAGTPWSTDRPHDWVAVRRWRDGAAAWVPREFVAQRQSQLGPSPPLITTITNGLGAGPSIAHSVEHGLCELLQRDGNCTAFRAMDRGRVIDIDAVDDPELTKLLALARSHNIRVMAKLARTDFGHVNVFVVGYDEPGSPWFPIQVTACGEAAHPDREVAIRKATLEFLAARARKAFMHGPLDRIDALAPPRYMPSYFERFDPTAEEPRALEAMCEWVGSDADTLKSRLSDTVFSQNDTVPLSTLPTTGDGMDVAAADRRLDYLIKQLADEMIEVYYVDLGDEHSRDHGVHAARVIAPGLECETMSYGRIGVRGVRRAIDEDLSIVTRDRRDEQTRPVVLSPSDAASFDFTPHLDFAAIDAIVGPLYPLYREPRSHAVQNRLHGPHW